MADRRVAGDGFAMAFGLLRLRGRALIQTPEPSTALTLTCETWPLEAGDDLPRDAGTMMPDPTVLVVMGVSGSGKSTVAGLLARRFDWAFADGDDFHTPEHIACMRAGHALDDADRKPWLALIGAWINARLGTGEGGVIICSALRRAYRDALVQGRSGVRIVYLEGSRAVIAERLSRRHGHFMPAGLLDSQFAALEPPGPDERPITVGIEDGPEAIAAAIATQLGASQES